MTRACCTCRRGEKLKEYEVEIKKESRVSSDEKHGLKTEEEQPIYSFGRIPDKLIFTCLALEIKQFSTDLDQVLPSLFL